MFRIEKKTLIVLFSHLKKRPLAEKKLLLTEFRGMEKCENRAGVTKKGFAA